MKFTLLVLIAGTLFSQPPIWDAVSASGANHSGVTGSISWTLGEVVSGQVGADSFLTQGYQQNWAFSLVPLTPSPERTPKILIRLHPLKHHIVFQVDFDVAWSVSILNAKGAQLIRREFESSRKRETLELKPLRSGKYLLHLETLDKKFKQSYSFVHSTL